MSVITATITTETTEGVQVGLPILATIGSVTIPGDVPKSTFDAKGDLLVGSGNDAFDNLAVGANGAVFMADSGQTLGAKWQALSTSDVSGAAPLASPTFTGTVVLPSSTSVGNVSSTELGYVDGVTSAIQTQIDGKVTTARTISTTSPITGGGDLSANRTFAIDDATTSAKGAVQLEDSTSSTSTTKAATPNSVLNAIYAGLDLAFGNPTVGEYTSPRWSSTANMNGLNSGYLYVTYFMATKTETITAVEVASNGTAAAATPTKGRVGIYAVDSAGALTSLLASTANNTALFASTFTVYSESLSGGNFSKVAGTWYGVGVLVVSATTMPSLLGWAPNSAQSYPGRGAARRRHALNTGNTDLPSSVVSGSMTTNSQSPFFYLK